MNMKQIFGANWKLNPVGDKTATAIEKAIKLIDGYAENGLADLIDREVLVFVPSPIAPDLSRHIKERDYGFKLGAQNISEHAEGPHTGQFSVSMMAEFGVTEFLIGHSERREGYEEKVAYTHNRTSEELKKRGTDLDGRLKKELFDEVLGHTYEMYNRKIISVFRDDPTNYKYPLSGKIRVTYCIGETLEERYAGRTFDVLETQLKKGLIGVSDEDMGRLIIAYEPIWAIGTGKTVSLNEIEITCAQIRDMTKKDVIILYGGSIRPRNAAQIMQIPGVDGGLIGNASLSADKFASIVLYDKK